MSIIDRIKARQSDRKAIEVPEWGEEDAPFVFYSGPLLAGEINRLQKKHPNFLASANFEGMVDLLLMKALDDSGEKLFKLDDKPTLMREEATIIARISAEIMGGSTSIEDHEKN